MKNKFAAATLVLLTGGALTKILGFILRIIITRQIGTEGIGLYSMLSPTFSLLTVIATFSYPTSLSTILSIKNRRAKPLLLSIIPISLLMNLVLILVVYFAAPYLSLDLLKESRLYYPIICISLTMPFVSLSSIVKGYFWGKQRMTPYMVSNVIEQVTRLVLITAFISLFVKKSLVSAICFIILVNIVGEIISIIIMLRGVPKREKISLKDLKPQKSEIKDVMQISVPSTSSKIVGSIAYFLEPIVVTNIFHFLGYSSSYILNEYGILNGYALSLLLLPSFFTQSMSYALIPELSKYFSIGDKATCKKRIKQIILSSLGIGFFFTLIIFIFPEQLLMILYKTKEGADYIRFLAPFTLLFFVEVPLLNAMQALGKAKQSMIITILGSIVKLIAIASISFLRIGMYSLVIAIAIGLVLNTYLYYKEVKKALI